MFFSVEELLVQLVVALLAEPQQAVELVRQAPALDHQADRVGHALRRMRHARRQQEDLAGADRDVAHRAVLLDAQHHLAFELVEPLRAFVPVVVGALVRAADDHHDEVAVVDHLVADRRLEQVAVLVDPGLQVDRVGQHGFSQSPAGGGGQAAMHLSSIAIGVGSAVMPSVVRHGARVDVGEVLGPDRVVGLEVARHVGEVDGDVDQVLPARAAGFEHGAHVGEHGAASAHRCRS